MVETESTQRKHLDGKTTQVTEAGKKEALREAVLGGTPAQRTMVFANSAQAADDICALLIREGADATCYHSGVPVAEREQVRARLHPTLTILC